MPEGAKEPPRTEPNSLLRFRGRRVFLFELQDGPHLDLPVPGARDLLGPLQCFVEIGAVEDVEATEDLLGLGERAIGENCLPALAAGHMDCGSGIGVVECFTGGNGVSCRLAKGEILGHDLLPYLGRHLHAFFFGG